MVDFSLLFPALCFPPFPHYRVSERSPLLCLVCVRPLASFRLVLGSASRGLFVVLIFHVFVSMALGPLLGWEARELIAPFPFLGGIDGPFLGR